MLVFGVPFPLNVQKANIAYILAIFDGIGVCCLSLNALNIVKAAPDFCSSHCKLVRLNQLE